MRTLSDLLGEIENEIESVRTIASTLESEFNVAAMMIDEGIDYRQKYVDQLKELLLNLRSITSTHPCFAIDHINQQNIEKMVAVASGERNN